MLFKYCFFTTRIGSTRFLGGKGHFWVRLKGANRVQLTIGYNVDNRVDETKLWKKFGLIRLNPSFAKQRG